MQILIKNIWNLLSFFKKFDNRSDMADHLVLRKCQMEAEFQQEAAFKSNPLTLRLHVIFQMLKQTDTLKIFSLGISI